MSYEIINLSRYLNLVTSPNKRNLCHIDVPKLNERATGSFNICQIYNNHSDSLLTAGMGS